MGNCTSYINSIKGLCKKEDLNLDRMLDNIVSENQKLKESIQELSDKNIFNMQMIDILHDKKDLEFCIKNGLICDIDRDIEDDIRKTQQDKSYEYIVFSGGGLKGLAFAGAVCKLNEINGMENIKGYAGTSIGSIIAAILAIGYKPDEMKEIIQEIEMRQFFDDKWGIIRDTINFLKQYGVAPGKVFYDFIGQKIKEKTGDPDYTFEQLYKEKNINLVIVGTNMNTRSSIYFYPNHINEKYRNVPIRKAVRISMSIPFVFEPCEFNGDICVDGGVLDNFPLHVFDGEYPGHIKARLNLIPVNPKVLGMNIIVNPVEAENYRLTNREKINNLPEYALSYITTVMLENQRRLITPTYWLRTVNIITENLSTTEFNLSEEQKNKLISTGEKSIEYFFKNNISNI
jgi:NTE family protein